MLLSFSAQGAGLGLPPRAAELKPAFRVNDERPYDA
jgi:hypothetical protein